MFNLLKLFKKNDAQAIGLLPFREKKLENFCEKKATRQRYVFKPDYSNNFFLI